VRSVFRCSFDLVRVQRAGEAGRALMIAACWFDDLNYPLPPIGRTHESNSERHPAHLYDSCSTKAEQTNGALHDLVRDAR